MFLELEEQNLSLITNSQDTEETLEEMKLTINKTRMKMDKETEILKNQIKSLNDEIKKERDREADLRIKASYFSYGQFNAEEQDGLLDELKQKVENVYRNCIGDNEANIDTLQMLTAVENRLEELFQKIEQMPAEKVEEAEKVKKKFWKFFTIRSFLQVEHKLFTFEFQGSSFYRITSRYMNRLMNYKFFVRIENFPFQGKRKAKTPEATRRTHDRTEKEPRGTHT